MKKVFIFFVFAMCVLVVFPTTSAEANKDASIRIRLGTCYNWEDSGVYCNFGIEPDENYSGPYAWKHKVDRGRFQNEVDDENHHFWVANDFTGIHEIRISVSQIDGKSKTKGFVLFVVDLQAFD